MSNKPYLTAEQVSALNEKYGWFQHGDAQSDVSRSFAQDAIAMHERMRDAAPELLEALQDLLEAADSMRGTYGYIAGITPEHEDAYIHDKWAEEFLQERADLARAAIAKARGQS